LIKYGFFKGWYKAIIRIKKCNPYNYESCVDYP
jgi:putative component of membrane protein insertase Oxa1/YidC/SpoIIIJ protein YidD